MTYSAAPPEQDSPDGSPMADDLAVGDSPAEDPIQGLSQEDCHEGVSPGAGVPSLAERSARQGLSSQDLAATGRALDNEGHSREAVEWGGAGAGRGEVLHLVVYAPWRGALELWPARQGPRLRTVSCCSNGR